jgi:hypothetical protein
VSGGAMEIGPNIYILLIGESSFELIALSYFGHFYPCLAKMLLGSGSVCVISLATMKLKFSSTLVVVFFQSKPVCI